LLVNLAVAGSSSHSEQNGLGACSYQALLVAKIQFSFPNMKGWVSHSEWIFILDHTGRLSLRITDQISVSLLFLSHPYEMQQYCILSIFELGCLEVSISSYSLFILSWNFLRTEQHWFLPTTLFVCCTMSWDISTMEKMSDTNWSVERSICMCSPRRSLYRISVVRHQERTKKCLSLVIEWTVSWNSSTVTKYGKEKMLLEIGAITVGFWVAKKSDFCWVNATEA
jgi:hypothetical protein